MSKKLLLILSSLMIFSGNLHAATISYRQGGGTGYTDINVYGTYISSWDKSYTFGNLPELNSYKYTSYYYRALISFPNIFGDGANQVPYGAIINSATLTLKRSYYSGSSSATYYLNRMTINWNEGSSWNSLNGGSWDGGQTFTPNVTTFNLDVTSSVQAWDNQTMPNYGWIIYTWTDYCSLEFHSDDASNISYRPVLTIDYSLPVVIPEPASLLLLGLSTFYLIRKKVRRNS
ncbi:MAG: DNRLRE domain-containing protein [Candidatus Auribacterota bacterium]